MAIDNELIAEHYGGGDLARRVSAELYRAGIRDGTLDWADLTSIDQFHVRGLSATVELAEAMDLAAGSAVLDVGCGLGGPARYLAAVRSCQVTGIDLSGAFIDVAQMLAERTGLSGKTTFVKGDALDLPFPDASFDFAWSQHVAMNISDRPKLYENIFRVLKPGGKLAIYDVVAGNGEPLSYPLPWAREPEQNFLLTLERMQGVLRTIGFVENSCADKTASGLSWLAEQRDGLKSGNGEQTLNLGVVMGPDFGQMVGNLARSLQDGRAGLIQAIYTRP